METTSACRPTGNEAPARNRARTGTDGVDHDFVYRIEILEDPPLVAVTTSGVATVSGWVRLHDGLRADPRVKGLPLLLDYTALDATLLTIGDVRSIGESVAALDRT